MPIEDDKRPVAIRRRAGPNGPADRVRSCHARRASSYASAFSESSSVGVDSRYKITSKQMSTGSTDLASLRLAAIVESTDDAIVGKDLQGVITSWNRAAERMFGFTAGEAVGRSIAMIIPNDRLEEEHGLIARIRNGEAIEHFETIRRRKDGVLFPVSLTVSPIFGADGTIIGATKIARDISDRKHAEVALATAEALQSDLQRRLFALVAASSKLLGSPRLDDVLRAFLALARELIA